METQREFFLSNQALDILFRKKQLIGLKDVRNVNGKRLFLKAQDIGMFFAISVNPYFLSR